MINGFIVKKNTIDLNETVIIAVELLPCACLIKVKCN